jgi:hypothetical protein
VAQIVSTLLGSSWQVVLTWGGVGAVAAMATLGGVDPLVALEPEGSHRSLWIAAAHLCADRLARGRGSFIKPTGMRALPVSNERGSHDLPIRAWCSKGRL